MVTAKGKGGITREWVKQLTELGWTPANIAKRLQISNRMVSYHLRDLRKNGLIDSDPPYLKGEPDAREEE